MAMPFAAAPYRVSGLDPDPSETLSPDRIRPAINLKTAKVPGIDTPATSLGRCCPFFEWPYGATLRRCVCSYRQGELKRGAVGHTLPWTTAGHRGLP